MFHQFSDGINHKKSEGSINKDQLNKVIKFIGRKNILNADEFLNRFNENQLKKSDVCFTFDDGLKCQYEIALPVLEDFQIKSFYFVYTSPYAANPNLLEVSRYFRINCFNNTEEFYQFFFDNCNGDLNNFFKEKQIKINENIAKFKFYTLNDIKFRLVRDEFLSKNQYNEIMIKLFEIKKFNYKKILKELYLDKNELINLYKLGNIIGLHSHNHPGKLNYLSYEDQLIEYMKNLEILSNLLEIDNKKIKTMSHPCGEYNNETIKVLKKMNIELGFKQVMFIEKDKNMKKINNSQFEIARQDISNIKFQ